MLLFDTIVSPIVEACPFENKDGRMSLLHSFYCWGAVGVILGSTLFFAVFGIEHWRILTLIWALVPLVNIFQFLTCPIERLAEDGESLPLGKLFRMPLLWMMILLMICSGASEATIAQWASAFTESALGVSKTVGDLAGPCLFAAFMGISRILYGKMSTKLNLTKAMLLSGLLCVACYLLASLSPLPILGLAGCALCGFSVGIMWPGTISLSSHVRFFGLGRGSRCYSQPGHGGKFLGNGRWQSENRTAGRHNLSDLFSDRIACFKSKDERFAS